MLGYISDLKIEQITKTNNKYQNCNNMFKNSINFCILDPTRYNNETTEDCFEITRFSKLNFFEKCPLYLTILFPTVYQNLSQTWLGFPYILINNVDVTNNITILENLNYPFYFRTMKNTDLIDNVTSLFKGDINYNEPKTKKAIIKHGFMNDNDNNFPINLLNFNFEIENINFFNNVTSIDNLSDGIFFFTIKNSLGPSFTGRKI